jgi:hypothetical protein
VRAGMVTIKNLDEAIFEAERFIKKAQEAKSRLVTCRYAAHGCKETASAKRASMDLTRSLSILRNSREVQS